MSKYVFIVLFTFSMLLLNNGCGSRVPHGVKSAGYAHIGRQGKDSQKEREAAERKAMRKAQHDANDPLLQFEKEYEKRQAEEKLFKETQP